MALRNVFTALADRLGPTIPVVGPELKRETASWPQITWEPKGSRLEAPRRIGGGAGDDGDVKARHWAVEIQIWGEDFDKTESMVDLFLATMHSMLSTFSMPNPTDEQWNTGGASADGCTCRIMIFIVAPVLKLRPDTVIATPIIHAKANDTEVT